MTDNTNKKKLNIKAIFVHITFWGFILLLPVVYKFVGPRLNEENNENRNLAEMPEFTWDTLSIYPLEFEAYYNDNFPFRSKLITANSRIAYQLFNEGVGSTIVGKDGWLFYNSESSLDGSNIGQFKGMATFTEEELRQAAESLEATAAWCEEHDMEFVLMICPNKERMYSEYMPDQYIPGIAEEYCNTDQLIEYLRENTDIRVVWAYEDLLEYKNDHPDTPVYYHLDTHWNYMGGYLGARALLRELGIEIPSPDERNVTPRELHFGDLVMLMNLGASDLFNDTDYKFEGYPVDGMQMLSDNVNGILSYQNPGRDPRNVVIYRDSFCNIMRYFLGEQFNTTNMIPKEYWDPSILENGECDVLVYEMTERFVSRLVDEHIQP